MPGTTSLFGLPYPLGTEAPNGPAQIKALADALEALLSPLSSAWTAYTPTWTGSTTNPVINNGTIDGKYAKFGHLVFFRIVITMGTTTTYGSGAWSLTFPVAPAAAGRPLFAGMARDTSASFLYWAALDFTSGSTGVVVALPTTAGNALSGVTSAVPFTWASTDVLTISGSYEAA